MALKELLERPLYPDTGKYDVEPDQQQLFKSLVPELTIDQLIGEVIDIVAHRSVTGSLIYNIQVLQPHLLQHLLKDLDLSAIPAPYDEEVRSGMLGTDFLYKTKESVLVEILKGILGQARVIGISLRSSSSDLLKHKQVHLRSS